MGQAVRAICVKQAQLLVRGRYAVVFRTLVCDENAVRAGVWLFTGFIGFREHFRSPAWVKAAAISSVATF